MPTRWAVDLTGGDPLLTEWRHLHGMVAGWLEHGRTVGEHRGSTPKDAPQPYAIRPLRHVAAGVYRLEISLLDDRLCAPLMASVERVARDGIWLGRRNSPERFEVHLQHGHHPLHPIKGAAWSDLVERSIPAEAFTFHCLTPAWVRSGNDAKGAPSPTDVFGGLRRRWAAYAPESMQPSLDLAACGLRVISCDGELVPVATRQGEGVGFIGRLTFMASTVERNRRVLDAVARLAPYAGIGGGTTRGLGVAEYLSATDNET